MNSAVAWCVCCYAASSTCIGETASVWAGYTAHGQILQCVLGRRWLHWMGVVRHCSQLLAGCKRFAIRLSCLGLPSGRAAPRRSGLAHLTAPMLERQDMQWARHRAHRVLGSFTDVLGVNHLQPTCGSGRAGTAQCRCPCTIGCAAGTNTNCPNQTCGEMICAVFLSSLVGAHGVCARDRQTAAHPPCSMGMHMMHSKRASAKLRHSIGQCNRLGWMWNCVIPSPTHNPTPDCLC